ncbi:MAG: hypothetical protein ABL878_16720, partial [Burkholderiales bacterium]
MTTYNWSALRNGGSQTITFVPGTDFINFDDPTITAASLGTPSFANAITGPNWSFTLAGITITLQTAIATMTSASLIFADGSKYLVGDETTGTANDSSANTLNGTVGDDNFHGLAGNDSLSGGAGNDSFQTNFTTGTFGNDTIDGGADFDTLIYVSGSPNPVTVNLSGVTVGSTAAHTALNAQGNISLTSIETVLGTAGNDVFTGGDSEHATDNLGNRDTERFRGNAGNDTITGAAGNDFFTATDYANNSAAQAVSVN